MSPRQPVVSGERLIKALGKDGWETVRQRGSHVRLKKPGRRHALVVPLHREIRKGTLAGIKVVKIGYFRKLDVCLEGKSTRHRVPANRRFRGRAATARGEPRSGQHRQHHRPTAPAGKHGGLKTVFNSVPDVPVKKFILNMDGGKKSLLVNSTNTCKGKRTAVLNIKGQNGQAGQEQSVSAEHQLLRQEEEVAPQSR